MALKCGQNLESISSVVFTMAGSLRETLWKCTVQRENIKKRNLCAAYVLSFSYVPCYGRITSVDFPRHRSIVKLLDPIERLMKSKPSKARLPQARARLKQRVNERTTELTAANEALKTEIAERKLA